MTTTPQDDRLEAILAKVTLHSAKGLTKVGLKRALRQLIDQEKLDLLAEVRNILNDSYFLNNAERLEALSQFVALPNPNTTKGESE